MSVWYSKFNKGQFIFICKLIESPEIFKRLFLLIKTQYFVWQPKKIFLRQVRPYRGVKIEMRIIGIIGNFLFLTSCSSLNKWNMLVDVDGLWVATDTASGQHYLSCFMASHTVPAYSHYGLTVGFDGAYFILLIRKGTFPQWVILAL